MFQSARVRRLSHYGFKRDPSSKTQRFVDRIEVFKHTHAHMVRAVDGGRARTFVEIREHRTQCVFDIRICPDTSVLVQTGAGIGRGAGRSQWSGAGIETPFENLRGG